MKIIKIYDINILKQTNMNYHHHHHHNKPAQNYCQGNQPQYNMGNSDQLLRTSIDKIYAKYDRDNSGSLN